MLCYEKGCSLFLFYFFSISWMWVYKYLKYISSKMRLGDFLWNCIYKSKLSTLVRGALTHVYSFTSPQSCPHDRETQNSVVRVFRDFIGKCCVPYATRIRCTFKDSQFSDRFCTLKYNTFWLPPNFFWSTFEKELFVASVFSRLFAFSSGVPRFTASRISSIMFLSKLTTFYPETIPFGGGVEKKSFLWSNRSWQGKNTGEKSTLRSIG